MDISDPYLRTASQAIKNGETEKASTLLMSMLANNPRNAEAWFLFSTIITEPPRIAACLRNVLHLQPDHEGAIQMMEQLRESFSIEPLQVMRVGYHSIAFGHTCPYCRDEFKALDEIIVCPRCHRSQHYDCWQENGHTCAVSLCDGFSLQEIADKPLPIQAEKTAEEVIILRKEDVSGTDVVTRKQKESRFVRKMLLMALAAEEGAIPPEEGDQLPSGDELLDQIQRDRSSDQQTTQIAQAIQTPPLSPEATLQTATSLPKYCLHCGQAYPRPNSKFCISCGQFRHNR